MWIDKKGKLYLGFPCLISPSFICVLLWITPLYAGEGLISTPALNGSVAIQTWKALRDDRIIKQDLDYSCGAASLATIIHEYYGIEVTEREILKKMERDGAASFSDLAQVAREFGFLASGIALSFEKLSTLRVPVIAYLQFRGDNHFSVIRGIGAYGRVWLADPSWGNRHFSIERFKAMWETRDHPTLKGKVLVVMPERANTVEPRRLFFRNQVDERR